MASPSSQIPSLDRCFDVAAGTDSWSTSEAKIRPTSSRWLIREAEALAILSLLHREPDVMRQRLQQAVQVLDELTNAEVRELAVKYIATLLPDDVQTIFHEALQRSRITPKSVRWSHMRILATILAMTILVVLWTGDGPPTRFDSGLTTTSDKQTKGTNIGFVEYDEELTEHLPPSRFANRWLIWIDRSGPWKYSPSTPDTRDHDHVVTWTVTDSPVHFLLIVGSDHDWSNILQSTKWLTEEEIAQLQSSAEGDPTGAKSFAVIAAALRRAGVDHRAAIDLKQFKLRGY